MDLKLLNTDGIPVRIDYLKKLILKISGDRKHVKLPSRKKLKLQFPITSAAGDNFHRLYQIFDFLKYDNVVFCKFWVAL